MAHLQSTLVEVRKRPFDGQFVVWQLCNRSNPAGVDQETFDAFAVWEPAAVCPDFRSAAVVAEGLRRDKAPSSARSVPGVVT